MTAKDQLLFDLFVTALEGGIGYWSECSEYHWSKPSGREDLEDFYAKINEFESNTGDDVGTATINRKTMQNGYAQATGPWRDRLYWSSGEKPPLVVTDDTDWDFDAGDADMIVQLGLFGEVIYG